VSCPVTESRWLAGARTRQLVVRLPAEIDLTNACCVGDQLASALALDACIVVADMSGTTFCDCQGARTLGLAHERATTSGAELQLVVPSTSVMRV